jgi:hypothetical protein
MTTEWCRAITSAAVLNGSCQAHGRRIGECTRLSPQGAAPVTRRWRQVIGRESKGSSRLATLRLG